MELKGKFYPVNSNGTIKLESGTQSAATALAMFRHGRGVSRIVYIPQSELEGTGLTAKEHIGLGDVWTPEIPEEILALIFHMEIELHPLIKEQPLTPEQARHEMVATELVRTASKYLLHPEVTSIPFALPSAQVGRALLKYADWLDQNKRPAPAQQAEGPEEADPETALVEFSTDDDGYELITDALDYYLSQGQGSPERRGQWIHELATNGGEVTSLDAAGIKSLIEELDRQATAQERNRSVYEFRVTGQDFHSIIAALRYHQARHTAAGQGTIDRLIESIN